MSFPRATVQVGLRTRGTPLRSTCNAPSDSQILRLLQGPQASPRFFSSSSPFRLPRYTPGQHNYGGAPRGQGFIDWDRFDPNKLVWAVIIANLGVFCAWQVAANNYKSGDPKLLAFMYKHFTSSVDSLKAGRIWTLVTSAFSHSELSHIGFNMFTFYFMGRVVAEMLGARHFMRLYLFGAVTSSLGAVAWESYIGRYARGLGASGAIDAVLGFLACAAPRMTFMIYGFIPVPAWLAVGGFFAYDVYGTAADNRPGVGTAAHVSGIVTGILWFFFAL